MRICICGPGSIGAFHRDALRQIEGVEIDSVVGRTPEPTREFARESGAPFATVDLEEALARPGLDAVVVSSPNASHFEHARASLEAGKHVLAEVPLSLSQAEAARLVALAETRGRTLMVCHTPRFYAATQWVKARIEHGELSPLHFHAEFEYFRRENVNWRGRRRSWTDNLLWHTTGHTIDQAIWLFGEAPVACNGFLGPSDNKQGAPLDLSAQMRFPGGGIATLATSYNAIVPKELEKMTLICREDLLVWQDLRLADSQGRVVADEPFEDAVLRQDREFVDSVSGGREPLTSARRVLPTYNALDAIERSAASES